MEQSGMTSQPETQPEDSYLAPGARASRKSSQAVLMPQQAYPLDTHAPTQDTAVISPPFVYGVGQIKLHFPNLSAEKEFAQAIGRAETVSLSDRQALYNVLSQRENRYLIRQLCWVFSIGGMETYILQPRDPADLDLFVEAVDPERGPSHMEVVIGIQGPIAPPEMCNGLMVPIVMFDQLYSFTREAFIAAVPRPLSIPDEQEDRFRAAVTDLFDRIMQITDNAGATPEDRALNYLAVRYPVIYARAAESFQQNSSLTAVQVRPASFSTTRQIMDVIFSYTDRQTDVVDKFSVRVDVTEEFPFLVSPLSSYYER
jgi:hypothetical protein